eukprot:scaffold12100_cov32-Cyclotella_meneghiniana.AAC.5
MQTFYRDDKADVSRFLFMSNDGDGEKVSRLNTVSALWYALTLEPVEVQNMLCVRIFEAVAIYGALLISTVYTIFGWRNKAKAEGDDTTLSAAFDCGGKNKLQTLASTRAMKLKMKYGIDKQQQGQYGIDKQQQRQNWESLDNLLRMAVTNLGRMEGSTISEYKGRLEKDWLTLVEHIQGRDVDFLNKYMPLLLAEEVHRLLKIESSEYCSSDHNDEA